MCLSQIADKNEIKRLKMGKQTTDFTAFQIFSHQLTLSSHKFTFDCTQGTQGSFNVLLSHY